MKDKELKEFVYTTIKLIKPLVEKELGEKIDYKLTIEEIRSKTRPDVPIDVPKQGILTLYRKGMKTRLEMPLKRGSIDEKIYALGAWVHAIPHELTHIWQRNLLDPQGISIYKKPIKYTDWFDGLAEIISWKILLKLYKNSKSERDYFKNFSLEGLIEAIRNSYYKEGIKFRLTELFFRYHLILKYYNIDLKIPEFLPKEIKNNIKLVIKKDKLNFKVSKEYPGIILDEIKKGNKKYIEPFQRYAFGFAFFLKQNNTKKYRKQLITNEEIEKILK